MSKKTSAPPDQVQSIEALVQARQNAERELHELQQQLRASETARREQAHDAATLAKRLHESQAVANIGSWETDLATLEVIWSRQTYTIFEKDIATFKPTHTAFLDLVHPDDRDAVNEAFVGSVDKLGPFSIEHRILMPDSRIKVVEECWRIFSDESGKPVRALGTCRDITVRKHAEDERDRLFRLSLDMLCIADFNGRLLQVNPAWTETLGWSAEELTSRPMLDFILPEDHEATRQIRHKIYQGIPVRGFENRYRCKDGSFRWLSWNDFPLVESRQVFAIAHDITEYKQREEKLKERENLLLSAQLIGRMGSWVTDVTNRRIVWSDATCSLFGITPAEFHGTFEQFYSFLLPEDLPLYEAIDFHVSSATPLLEAEYRIRRPDGQVRWMYQRGVAEYDDNGKQIRRMGMVMDITEQRIARELLRHHEELLRMAGHLARLGGWSIELPDLRINWSNEARTIYDVPAETTPTLDEFIHFYPVEDREAVILAIEKCIHEGTPFDLELQLTPHHGSSIWVRLIGKAEYDTDGNIKQVQGAVQDVTERKHMEVQILRAQRFESIGTLAGGIAHDLNNVLAPIMISSEMLEMDIKDAASLEVVRLIRKSAQRAVDLVQQVLSFSRGNEGKRTPVDVEQVAAELNKIAHDTFPKNIITEMSSEPGLWQVMADPTQLHQVLLNLYVNSRDAMPDGGKITVKLGNQVLDEIYAHHNPDSKPGCYVVVSVTDNGQGIPTAIHNRIFDPFFTTKEIGKGTGLGLSTSVGIVKGYGGFVTVYSEVGRGTTFNLYFPALLDESRIKAVESSQENLLHGDGELILVVDDEEDVRHSVQQILERFGYQVVLAGNGAEAVSIYSRLIDSVAVVLTDMSMPRMDGRKTIKALTELNPRLQIIGSSGLEVNEHVVKADGTEIKYFISKPYTVETILKTLAQVIAESKVGS
jgi:PAS domain S-box-containing protein